LISCRQSSRAVDHFDWRFRFAAAGLVTFVPPALIMVLFWLLPETRGREPEDLWPAT